MTWAKQQRALLTGDALGNSYRLPERIATDYELCARISGVLSGSGQNVKIWRVDFTFGEILPKYPRPA
jgi:hypothetical protein